MRHAIHTAFKNTAERVLPVRNQSAFKEKGVLTPDEFVTAGDYLVRTCPTWSWEAGDGNKSKAYLPSNKQYLVTRNVPSYRRAAAVEGYESKADVMLEDNDNDGWVAPVAEPGQDAHGNEEHIPSVDEHRKTGQPAQPAKEGEDEENIPDIDDLELVDAEEDEAALPQAIASPAAHDGEDGIVRTRTYDLLITYDKFYQVPRFWLVGYSETRQPLQSNQVLEDVSQEHARKTITVDPFPHGSITAASIHPCKHASVMQKLTQMAEATGKDVRVDNYLVLFLKFIASVIPTIEYDYTMAAGW